MDKQGYRDYFKVLGVERTAKDSEIKQAFRKLARKYHPDVNRGDPKAEDKFKQINEAYEVLLDPDKRRRYEQFGQYWNQNRNINFNQNPSAGFDFDYGRYGSFDDFINDLLGRFSRPTEVESRGFSGRYVSKTGFPRNPNNLDANIALKINFSEAFHGTERTLSINDERVQVKIPRGVVDGSKLRIKGKGNFQPGTGKRGDLYLKIEVQLHPIWKLKGNQIQADLPVCIDEIILGAIITVITPDGETKLTIPPGTNFDQNLRLKGKGWPSGKGRGDLIFTIKLELPSNWSSHEIEVFKELQKLRSNDPRKEWLISAHL